MHQVELDGTRKYSKRSICSGAEGLRLNSQSEVEEVTCNCTRMHAPTRIDCLPIHFSAAEEVVTMLPTAAATPGRPTAATGINASSSVAISPASLSTPQTRLSLASTNGHQIDYRHSLYHGTATGYADTEAHYV